MKNLKVFGGKYFDYPILDTFGCRRTTEDMVMHPQWSTIFEWMGNTYSPFTYEFLATLEIKKEPNNSKSSISFILFNKKYTLSLNDLAKTLEIYTQEEIESPAFRNYWSNFYLEREAADYWKEFL